MSDQESKQEWVVGDRFIVNNPASDYHGITGTIKAWNFGERQYFAEMDYETERSFRTTILDEWELEDVIE